MSIKRKRWKAPGYVYPEDLMQLTGLGRTKCTAIIAQLNEELDAKGYITLRGRVPIEYVRLRFYGFGEHDGRWKDDK